MKIVNKTDNNKIQITTLYDSSKVEEITKRFRDSNIEYMVTGDPNVDFVFFEAYLYDQNGPKYDPSLGKEIMYNYFRKARTPLLEKLDVDFMRAVESGNTTLQQEIASKKQELRDITLISLSDDLKTMKNSWPSILGKSPFV